MGGDEPRDGMRAISGRVLRGVTVGVAALTAATMVAAARVGEAAVVTLGAVVFATAAVLVSAITLNQALRWSDVPNRNAPLAAHVALLQTSRLTALFYAWGAVAMQGLYLTQLTGLKWQHGWQYAAAMALLALMTIAFERTLPRPLPGRDSSSLLRHMRLANPIAIVQALVAGIGLTALVVSGKLWSERPDWAANRVFAALAVAVFAVSVASMVAQHRHRDPAQR